MNAETIDPEFNSRAAMEIERVPDFDYLRDLYGHCDRDGAKVNDCYWGKDARGHENGCLKVGWSGRACPHWRPLDETNAELFAALVAVHTPLLERHAQEGK